MYERCRVSSRDDVKLACVYVVVCCSRLSHPQYWRDVRSVRRCFGCNQTKPETPLPLQGEAVAVCRTVSVGLLEGTACYYDRRLSRLFNTSSLPLLQNRDKFHSTCAVWFRGKVAVMASLGTSTSTSTYVATILCCLVRTYSALVAVELG